MMATSVEDGHQITEFNAKSFQKVDADKDDEGSDENYDLSLVGSRNAKWWYSTYHNVTAIVGAGVLGLPPSMAYLGWGAGAVVLVLSWFITLFTLWQMVQMQEPTDENGKVERIDTYYRLGQKAFGPKLGLWIVLPQQVIFAQLGDFNSIASVSLLSCVMSICYCTIAWIESLNSGKYNHSPLADPMAPSVVCPTSYQFSNNERDYLPHITKVDQVFGVFSALGVVAFAYSGHNVVLEIQGTLPSTKEQPAKVRMWRGVMVAYIIVAICYFPVAFVGFWAFGSNLTSRGASAGDSKSGNILLQLGKPRRVIAAAHFFVAVHVTGSYLVFAIPMFELITKSLEMKFGFRRTPPKRTSMMQIVIRSTYVVFTAFVALSFPFFSDLLSFIGGFALTPTTYFLPCIIWLKLRKPKAFGISWLLNWVLIIVGVLLAIVATIGGMGGMVSTIRKVATNRTTVDYLDCNNTVNYPKQCTPVNLPRPISFTFYNHFTCDSSNNFDSIDCNVSFSHFSAI